MKAHKTGIISPGGATVCGSGDRMLLHGFCTEAKASRCMYVAGVTIIGKAASVA